MLIIYKTSCASKSLVWVWGVTVKGKKITLKNPPSKMFCEHLAGKPYLRDTHETDSPTRLFSFQSYASHVALSWVSFSRASRKIHLIFN